jgi:hypothetical protein
MHAGWKRCRQRKKATGSARESDPGTPHTSTINPHSRIHAFEHSLRHAADVETYSVVYRGPKRESTEQKAESIEHGTESREQEAESIEERGEQRAES